MYPVSVILIATLKYVNKIIIILKDNNSGFYTKIAFNINVKLLLIPDNLHILFTYG